MLCDADRSLIARDRQLPGLATLLDEAALLLLLQSAGQDLQRLTSHYVRYKSHTNCLVAYEAIAQGQTHRGYGKVFAPGQGDKLQKYLRLGRSARGGSARGGSGEAALRPLVQADLGLAIAPFPWDRALKSLGQLCHPSTQRDLLRILLLEHFDRAFDREINLKTLNYKPERRYVAQVTLGADSAQRWVLKLYTPAQYDRALCHSRELQSGAVLRHAPLVGCNHRHHMLAFPWVDDRPLGEQMQEAPTRVRHSLSLVGTALAELHSQRHQGWRRVSCAAEARDLMEMLSDLCHLFPQRAGMIKSLGRTLADRLMQLPQQWRCTHGDFKPDQVLTQGSTVTLLDFDRAALAHPARDLGSFMAQLEYQTLRGTLDDRRRTAAIQGLLTGYAAQAEDALTPEMLQLYQALHLFKLLPEPFRYRSPDWPMEMEKLLCRIELMLQRDGRGLEGVLEAGLGGDGAV